MKNLKNLKKTKTFYSVTLILLLALAVLPLVLDQNKSVANAQAVSTVPSDMLQYEWPTFYGDTSAGWYTANGPGPTVGDYLWTSDLGQPRAAFNGLLFLSGGHAVDPMTGRSIYNSTYGNSRPTKFDETRFYAGNRLYETATGKVLATFDQSIPNYYDAELGMFWKDVQGGGIFNVDALLQGWNFPSDFSQNATLAYSIVNSNGFRAIDYFYGKVFFGSGFGSAICLDGKTGDLLWETPISGYLAYHGAFSDGIWTIGSQDGVLYGIDTTNGDILWEFRPSGEEAFFSFWEDAGAISNGVLYAINTQHYTYAIDIYTGELIWKWKSDTGSAYQTHPSACNGDDNNPGLVFGVTGRRAGALGTYYDPETHVMLDPEFVALNQITGQCEWKTDAVNVTSAGTGNAMCAYGNLYVTTWDSARAPTIIRDQTVCVSSADRPYPSFHNDLANTGNGWTFSAPEQLNLNWVFEGEGAFIASPVAADGKIFIGSTMGIFYCLDYQTGDEIWRFTLPPNTARTETIILDGKSTSVTLPAFSYSILSSAALDDDKVFFQADDGNTYCLNADDGSVIWQQYTGSDVTFMSHTTVRYTGSPKVYEGKVYVGSRNGVFYCLDEDSGEIVWKRSFVNGSIFNAPAIDSVNKCLYITVGGESQLTMGPRLLGTNGSMYKLNLSNGNIIWRTDVEYLATQSGQISSREFFGSPVLGDNGLIYVPTNSWATYAYNTTSGKYLWNYTTPNGGGLIGSVTPAYANGKLYIQDDFFVSAIDATTGSNQTPIWSTYNAHSVLGGISFADNKVYWASEVKACYVADANTGEKLGYYEWDSFCWSNPAFYEGMLYWSTTGQKVYCFKDVPYGTTYNYPNVTAALSKSSIPLGDSVSVSGDVEPALSGIKLMIYAIDPNGNSQTTSATTQIDGTFVASFTPPVAGSYDITTVTDVDDPTFAEASNVLTLEVVSPTPTLEPTPNPTTDAYVVGSAIAMVAAIGIAAFLLIRRKKINKK